MHKSSGVGAQAAQAALWAALFGQPLENLGSPPKKIWAAVGNFGQPSKKMFFLFLFSLFHFQRVMFLFHFLGVWFVFKYTDCGISEQTLI